MGRLVHFKLFAFIERFQTSVTPLLTALNDSAYEAWGREEFRRVDNGMTAQRSKAIDHMSLLRPPVFRNKLA